MNNDNNGQNDSNLPNPINPQPTWPSSVPAQPSPSQTPPAQQTDPLTPNFSMDNQPPLAPAPTPQPTWNPVPKPEAPDLNSNAFTPPPSLNPLPPQEAQPLYAATQPETSLPPQDLNSNLPPNPLNPSPINNTIQDPVQPGTGLPQIPLTPTQPGSEEGQQTPFQGPIDSAPTDLSHLIGNNDSSPPPPPEIYTPGVSTQTGTSGAPPVPPANNQIQPSADSAMETGGKHISLGKILIIVGVIALLLVSGLSAYFFFGPGKNTSSNNQTSAPAVVQTQAPLTNPPKQIVEPTFAPTSSASASTTFGGVGNESTTSGKSTLEILRSRQSPTPTPR